MSVSDIKLIIMVIIKKFFWIWLWDINMKKERSGGGCIGSLMVVGFFFFLNNVNIVNIG